MGVDNIDYIINEKNFVLIGIVVFYLMVKFYVDGVLIVEVRINKNGRWEYILKVD